MSMEVELGTYSLVQARFDTILLFEIIKSIFRKSLSFLMLTKSTFTVGQIFSSKHFSHLKINLKLYS